jgi:hypothetical protein
VSSLLIFPDLLIFSEIVCMCGITAILVVLVSGVLCFCFELSAHLSLLCCRLSFERFSSSGPFLLLNFLYYKWS